MNRRLRAIGRLVPVLLLVEFVDELVFGAREAAWPQIRDDLALSYVEVGILLALPTLTASLLEMPVSFLGDTRRRKLLILSGGGAFVAALLLTAQSQSFWALLAAFALLGPASGAFVSLSQASLADHDPSRREQNMARWTLAGSVGVLVGSVSVGAADSEGLSWRVLFVAAAAVSLATVAIVSRSPVGLTSSTAQPERPVLATLREGFLWALRAVSRPDIVRWLVLLELSDLVGDILLGYLALYLVDIGGANPTEAAVGVAIWSGAGLAGDLLVVLLLERMRGLTYLRVNSVVSLTLLVAFLLFPSLEAKLLLGGLLGLTIGGRYAILQAQLYGALPGRSASALALNNTSNVVGSLLPAAIGAAAAAWGLGVAMWLLVAGPLALLVATPRDERPPTDVSGAEQWVRTGEQR